MIRVDFTERQREIIVGTLLGDGHLETRTQGRTYMLKIEHGYSQKTYVDWLYQELLSMTLSRPKVKFQMVRGKMYQKYWFNSVTTGSLRFYGQQFYEQKKKVVPQQIGKWLTPLGLAVWFMDDGSIKSKECSARIMNTQCYDETSLDRLISTFSTRYNIVARKRQQREGQQLYIPASETGKLKEIIGQYVLPSMQYKLG
jgi:hypothetical protein